MEKEAVYRAAAVAALVAFVCALIMGFVIMAPEPGMSLQPSLPEGPVTTFTHVVNQYPQQMLNFFAVDSLFVLSYMVVFAGLYAVTAGRSQALAAIGLGAGLLTALFDATENAFFIVYASLAQAGVPLTEPALPLIYVLANLKWMGAFAAIAAFGLAWPRDSRMGWVLAVFMLVFPLVGIVGVAMPQWTPLRGLFFLLGMPLFAWYFWRVGAAASRLSEKPGFCYHKK